MVKRELHSSQQSAKVKIKVKSGNMVSKKKQKTFVLHYTINHFTFVGVGWWHDAAAVHV